MSYDTTKPFKKKLKEIIQETWKDNPYVDVRDGYYPSFTRKHQGIEIDHTDGLGTKGVLHWQHKTFQAAAQDALAMNVNDLSLAGAVGYKTQAHLMLPKDDHEAIVNIMQHLADLCKIRKIAITGGETSIHDNLEGMELSLTVTGVVVEVRSGKASSGDRLVCIPSNGPHSNGFTFIRSLFGDEYRPWMTEPTRLYDLITVGRKLPIHAAMHITGGAFSKLREILPENHSIVLDEWQLPAWCGEVFDKMMKINNYDKDNLWANLYKTLNMGIGMVLAVPAADAHWVATATGGFVTGEVSNNGKSEIEIGTLTDDISIIL